MFTQLLQLSVLVQAAASDPPPSENDVVAGWVGGVVLVALAIAVVFILRSFTKQLKKVEAADQAGVYDEQPGSDTDGSDSGHPPTTIEQDH
jgi:TRAP-type C4-dicarboxylate transport system permease small subunit